jgi:O-antigen biosynthesis protein
MTPVAPATSSPPPTSVGRVRAAGKFFQDSEGQPQWWNGVSYGPFPPNCAGEPYPEAERLEADFKLIRAMRYNVVRLYEPPTDAIFAAAAKHGLRLLVGLTWTDHVDFLASQTAQREILQRVEAQAARLAQRPEVVGLLVGNELEKSLVRWMGPPRVQRFLDRLITAAKKAAPELLCGYATYPSTEYLMPRTADFHAVNIYLEQPEALRSYLAKLQHQAGNKPLVVTEFGLDVKQHGVETQAEMLRWQRRILLESGVAGGVWFAFTDEWQRGGQLVVDWQFGLLTADRKPRPASAVAAALPTTLEPAKDPPKFSVIVCTRNGSATLRACLESLQKLNYPAFELLLIDDGSTDDVPTIAKAFPQVRYVRQEPAGLSVARNRGMQEAKGSLLAYTDDDCIVHPDWLLHLSHAFAASPKVAAAGGPNIPPPPRNSVEAVVAAAPGAPAHVLLDNVEAEHLPGCNLAIRKAALEYIGGFQPVFTSAGDDVDICWRLREVGGTLRFAPGAMVWHHRRFTVTAYLKQQRGYGRAEALLMKAHPERFGAFGGARWKGLIYGDAPPLYDPVEGVVFHGPLGEGLFQGIYRQAPAHWVEWFSGWLWIALTAVALALQWPWAAVALFGTALLAAIVRRRALPPTPFALGSWQELLLLALCWAQPVVREGARLWGMIRLGARPAKPLSSHADTPKSPSRPPKKHTLSLGQVQLWSDQGITRQTWLNAFFEQAQTSKIPLRRDDGWRRFDLEMHPRDELSTAVLSMTEYHGEGKCLTRVALLLRLTTGILFAIALVIGLEIALILNEREMLQQLGRISLLPTLATLTLAPWLAARSLRKKTLAAAAAAGLTPVDRKQPPAQSDK